VGKKAPKAPDPVQTAQAQQQYNQQAFNASSLDKSGPAGSSTFNRDANGNVTGITSSFSPQLQQGWDSGTNATSSLMGLLPTEGINWDDTTASNIAQNNIANYQASVAPLRQQQQAQLTGMMSDRGLPVGSEIWNNQWGNLNRDFANADVNAVAQAWNAVPGMQAQLTQNAINQYNQPINSAAGSLGLLQNMNSLIPQAQQPGQQQAVNYSGLAQQNYQNQIDAYNNQMGGLGQLASTGLGLLTAPMTGGTSLFGSLAGNLFNSAQPQATTSGWDPAVFSS
jgi:hypothetical protein